MNEPTHQDDSTASFAKKVWIAGGIIALIVVVLVIFKNTFPVFILILAGALIALFFRGFGALIHRKTGISNGWSMALSFIIVILFIGGLSWLIGNKVSGQVSQLSQTLPTTIENAKNWLQQYELGKQVVENITSDASRQKARAIVGTFFKSSFGFLGDLYVVILLGLFFTAAPSMYNKGVVKLLPPRHRERGKHVWQKLGTNLQKWLKGKLFAMLVVTVLTAIGLLIIGMPMWLALAIIAGLLNFIPNFGPLIAMIPAVLVALLQGPMTAAIVAGLYIVVQVAESNFITPMVQQKLVSIPPALIIIAQLLVGSFAGAWGIILATPLMLIVMVLVKELYVKPMENKEGA